MLAMVASLADAVEASKITVWLGVSGALLGCGDVLVTFLWARFSATLDLRQVYLYVTLCNGASLVLYFVATLLPGPVVLPLAAALFLASALAAQRSLVLRGEEDGGWTLDPTVARALFRDLWHPILGTTILCFMGGLMLQISGLQDISLGTFQQTSLWASAAAIACLLVPALVVRKLPNLTRVYSVALPVSAAGFLLLPLIWNAAGGIVNAFVQVGAMVAGIILWCMLADAAHRTRTSPILLFSVAFLATSAAQLAGTLVGWVNVETLRQGDLALTAIALVSVYLLLLGRHRPGSAIVRVHQVPRWRKRVRTCLSRQRRLSANGVPCWPSVTASRRGERYLSSARPGLHDARYKRASVRFREHREVPREAHLPKARHPYPQRAYRPGERGGGLGLRRLLLPILLHSPDTLPKKQKSRT